MKLSLPLAISVVLSFAALASGRAHADGLRELVAPQEEASVAPPPPDAQAAPTIFGSWEIQGDPRTGCPISMSVLKSVDGSVVTAGISGDASSPVLFPLNANAGGDQFEDCLASLTADGSSIQRHCTQSFTAPQVVGTIRVDKAWALKITATGEMEYVVVNGDHTTSCLYDRASNATLPLLRGEPAKHVLSDGENYRYSAPTNPKPIGADTVKDAGFTFATLAQGVQTASLSSTAASRVATVTRSVGPICVSVVVRGIGDGTKCNPVDFDRWIETQSFQATYKVTLAPEQVSQEFTPRGQVRAWIETTSGRISADYQGDDRAAVGLKFGQGVLLVASATMTAQSQAMALANFVTLNSMSSGSGALLKFTIAATDAAAFDFSATVVKPGTFSDDTIFSGPIQAAQLSEAGSTATTKTLAFAIGAAAAASSKKVDNGKKYQISISAKLKPGFQTVSKIEQQGYFLSIPKTAAVRYAGQTFELKATR